MTVWYIDLLIQYDARRIISITFLRILKNSITRGEILGQRGWENRQECSPWRFPLFEKLIIQNNRVIKSAFNFQTSNERSPFYERYNTELQEAFNKHFYPPRFAQNVAKRFHASLFIFGTANLNIPCFSVRVVTYL